jgi:hypothetical protein
MSDEAEIVDGVPVVAGDPPSTALEPARGVVPARQAAALAATSFVAGAATVAVVSRRRPLRRRKRRKAGGPLEVVASNSFLVDVHLLRRG